jgi:MFS family permease
LKDSKIEGEKDPYAVLRLPEYRYFILSRFLIMVAIQIQGVAVGWQVYQLTKDPLSLGIIGLVEAIPSITVALYAGHLADRTERKKIMLFCITIFFLCALSLFLFTLDTTQNLFGFSVYHIYAVIFVSGIARGFMSPASFGLMSQIVPKELYANSSLWGSTAFQFGLVTGPAIGGLLYGFMGVSVTYFIVTTLVLMALISINLITARPKPEIINESSLKESLLAGLKFVFNNQIFLGALTLDLFAVLFGGAVALLPIFAAEILNVGPKGLGLLRAAPAIGAVTISWALAHYSVMRHAGRNLLIAVAGFGLCMIFFGLSTSFYLSLFLLALSGMLDNISVVVRSTIMQTMTPDNMRGRVSAVNSIFIGSSNEIGSFESGVAAKILGVVPSVVFGGCMTLIVVGITALKGDKLRKLDLEKSD